MEERKTVSVFVRKVGKAYRLSFSIPKTIPRDEVKKRGLKIESRSAIVRVTRRTHIEWSSILDTFPPHDQEMKEWCIVEDDKCSEQTIDEALRKVKGQLTRWLKGRGFEAKFT